MVCHLSVLSRCDGSLLQEKLEAAITKLALTQVAQDDSQEDVTALEQQVDEASTASKETDQLLGKPVQAQQHAEEEVTSPQPEEAHATSKGTVETLPKHLQQAIDKAASANQVLCALTCKADAILLFTPVH